MQTKLVPAFIVAMLAAGCAMAQTPTTMPATSPASPDQHFKIGSVLFTDDFMQGTDKWSAEFESGGKVEARDGRLEIDVPGGCSVWFKQEIEGPVLIEYDTAVIKAGGPNDRVSDLNCFWMATDPRSPGNILAVPRSGKFADYNQLKCYYVGLGGNTNTTTRFRRYIGDAVNRPLLPEHDLQEAKYLITPNVKQKIQLIAFGNLIQYYRNGEKIFEYVDPNPYTKGWFALRTVTNHMIIENFSVRRLEPAASTEQTR